ncbi:di-trans,poly-cis-decaprenylcistransferase [Patescibacteria group bacterium]|nr:di-trans,poly-cis-decaprenylcistransferase [Patescibacteria group bacterium]
MQPIRSIGIILDGNRRWAKAKGLPPFEGHRAGYEALKKLAAAAPELKKKYGLEYVTLYCFSTENWNRATEEVGYLIKLFEEALSYVLNEVLQKNEKDPKNGIRLKVVGQRERFSETLQKLMKEAEERTAHFGGVTAVFALSYGGRAEIVVAAQKLQKENKEITEESLAQSLWGAGVPDPDIIIRTGGEQRLSNFLTWQSVYSELFFPEVLWPEFTVAHLEKIFEEYYARDRRLGK